MAPVHVTVSLCISYILILWLIGWYCSIKFNKNLSETNIGLDRSCLGLLLGSCQVGGVSTSDCYALKKNILYLKKARSYLIFTLAFISFREYLYLCILFLLLQSKAAQNEPVPLGAMLTKGAVRDNLPPVARVAALLEFIMAPHVETRTNASCYKQSLVSVP